MKWKGRTRSSNVEDRRGSGSFPIGGKGVFGGGLGIIVIIAFLMLGGDPGQILGGSQWISNNGTVYEQTAEEQELAEFVSVVLADTESAWEYIFSSENLDYQPPKLVLYSGYIQSACGAAGASTGPFYCTGDGKVYIDLSFYQELQTTFHAPGDFAMAYVIAHEVGHHVQNELGVMDEIQRLRSRVSQDEYNELSVRLELQADYLAGVWAHYAEEINILDEGDIKEALDAASAVGDDRIQKQTQGYIVPDSFTHGTSAQRVYWFLQGYQEGDLDQWDTFSMEYENL